jgi:hypothetical protein
MCHWFHFQQTFYVFFYIRVRLGGDTGRGGGSEGLASHLFARMERAPKILMYNSNIFVLYQYICLLPRSIIFIDV